LVVLAAVMCAGGVPGTVSAAAAPEAKTSTVKANGLVLTLTVKPRTASVGTTVQFKIYFSAAHAHGALGYVLQYGDGTTSANPIPLFCLAGPGRPAHATWDLAHRYARPGNFKVVASGYANCGPGRLTTTVHVLVS